MHSHSCSAPSRQRPFIICGISEYLKPPLLYPFPKSEQIPYKMISLINLFTILIVMANYILMVYGGRGGHGSIHGGGGGSSSGGGNGHVDLADSNVGGGSSTTTIRPKIHKSPNHCVDAETYGQPILALCFAGFSADCFSLLCSGATVPCPEDPHRRTILIAVLCSSV